MPRKHELETALEDRCVARIEALGGMALKLRPPTGRGFPDRTVFLPSEWRASDLPPVQPDEWRHVYGKKTVFFLEFKRSRVGVTSTQQHKWRMLLTQLGFGVYFVDSDAAFEAALERELGR